MIVSWQMKMVISMQTSPFKEAKPILKRLAEHGHQAYFVGGCVRDMLLDRAIGDVDIATSAKPVEVQQIFEKVIPVGIEHGTVIVRHQHESYEVTTFRLEGTYSDNRHPDQVEFIQTIEQDLQRRDFTMNALAMDIDGNIIDPFNGKQDLKYKRICTVGKAAERFQEDPLRMIRAVRFVSQLGFSIEPVTQANMIKFQQQIKGLAVERITTEIAKMFAGKFIQQGIDCLRSTGIYRQLPVMEKYPGILSLLPPSIRPLHSFAEVIALFHIVKPAITIDTWVKHWKCSNKQKQEAVQLVNAWLHYQSLGLDQWLVYRLDRNYFSGFVRLGKNLKNPFAISIDDLERKRKSLPITSLKELAVNGNDIIQLFPNRQKGSWIKRYLSILERKVVYGTLKNNKNELKEWIIWNPPETN